MRGELSESVSVPQVFEPGARVERGGHVYILKYIEGGWWRGYDGNGVVISLGHEATIGAEYLVAAPAPREGQRWRCENYGRPIFAGVSALPECPGGVSVVGENGCPLAEGCPIDAARWLLDSGYSYAAPAAPAPWTLADARRLILDAIRSAEPRHPAAFTAALCSMAEFAVPGERLIRATSEALGAAEDRLPERGAIAPWQEEFAARAAREALERAFGRGRVPLLCVDACARYLERRAGR
ncbi:hypothetical protein [Sorangium sp. So ce1024]|uniref:hypothetical protein n=1 Tax=Sorangium sp. So ce1024 TaxID=3133327 RepID=UPI003F04754C